MLTETMEQSYLTRIENALQHAASVAREYVPGQFHVVDNGGRNVVTEVDRKISEVLHGTLLQPGEGWLSEEDVDDRSRLNQSLVWIVDPLDGTREFVDGIPEWCISIGLVIEGEAVAGGVLNPARQEIVLGGMRSGVTYNGRRASRPVRASLNGASVLASRQEYLRGEWSRFEGQRFHIKPVGSVAYKLALVAAGLADATWTLTPKHEWDVAAGVALVRAAGGVVRCIGADCLRFNQPAALLPGLLACDGGIAEQLLQLMQAGGVPV